MRRNVPPTIYRLADFVPMRRSGKLVAETLDMVEELVVPGVTTAELDQACSNFITAQGGRAASLNYRGFPCSVCTSVNEEVCHGIPSQTRVLSEGDIVNVDVAVEIGGWFGDSSRTYGVGKVLPTSPRALVARAAYEALQAGIAQVGPGARMGDIGAAIMQVAKKYDLSVVEDFCGHGLGRSYHESPTVLHFGVKGEGLELRPGMFFTVEPMLNVGTKETQILKDGWTVKTLDRKDSAQFEHSLGVTHEGCEVFTYSPQGRDFPLEPGDESSSG